MAALRERLGGLRFTAEAIRDALGAPGAFTPRRADAPVHLRRLSPEPGLATLIRLFVVGVDVDAAEVAAALTPVGLPDLQACGLLAVDGARARAPLRLIPLGGLVFACDPLEGDSGTVGADQVAGPAAASAVLANITVRRPVETALDVGTGCGVQALLARAHAAHVVATDVNQRALAFAAFNAALNGQPAIELRPGSLLDPVAGETFGLIVSNPPFVISPEFRYVYRDSGRPGDEMCRELVRALPEHLRDDGFAHVLVSWGHRQDEAWAAPLRRWIAGLGCDAWLLRTDSQDPVTHAATWNRPTPGQDAAAYGAALDHWVRYCGELGIERIASGAVVLRRRRGGGRVREDVLTFDRIGDAGAHVLRLFEAQAFLADLTDDATLLTQRLRLVPHHRIDQSLRLENGRAVVERASLRLTKGLRLEAEVDATATRLLAYLDGRRPLGEALERTARETPDVSGRAARERFTRAALTLVVKMLEAGFLERVNPPRPSRS